ncbi:MAG: hypothetical protein LBK65_03565 [Tannerellaceae bacterium]|jgi:hypothetical protein|nr:hypothetical protein [Tannerellaceae bacterium]
MNSLIEIFASLAGILFEHVGAFFSLFSDSGLLPSAGGGVTLALALGATGHGNISEGVLADIRKWHGSINDQYGRIDNILIQSESQTSWSLPMTMAAELTNNRDRLQTLISRCRSSQSSKTEREMRNALLRSTVGYCLMDVKVWAHGEFTAGLMTAEDVHLLGFLLPGETGGYHRKVEATDAVAQVKVKVITADIIRVVIDHSSGENAGPVAHGWPPGVRHALIVIISDDGKTEIYRQPTTRLHNDIRMPDGSHGKQFMIKASFLKHLNDEPRFGAEPTFSMPLTTEELAALHDRQHHEEFEAQIREVERQRLEIEALHAAMNAKK